MISVLAYIMSHFLLPHGIYVPGTVRGLYCSTSQSPLIIKDQRALGWPPGLLFESSLQTISSQDN